ncbi:winged helix DNA-binding domain-containing protein [Burkholderia stagnalis]
MNLLQVDKELQHVKLDPQQTFIFCLNKQHVIPGNRARDVEHVAETLVGIHAARLITPYFALRARLDNVRHGDIYAALHEHKTLIKARCMRGTLHLLPRKVFNAAHGATLAKRLSVCRGMYKKLGILEREVDRIKGQIVELVSEAPRPSQEIERMISVTSSDPLHSTPVIRAAIKELWELGVLCYLNGSPHFGTEKRLYGLTSSFYSALIDGASLDEGDGITALVRRYVFSYGPATLGDIAWWSGLDRTRIKRALDDLSEELCTVQITGFKEYFWISRSDSLAVADFSPPQSDWAALLAYEDPSLKGYHASRSRYVRSKDYDLLFNDIGEARPAILLNGMVVGVWTLERHKATISIELFRSLNSRQKNLINHEVESVRADLPALLRAT